MYNKSATQKYYQTFKHIEHFCGSTGAVDEDIQAEK